MGGASLALLSAAAALCVLGAEAARVGAARGEVERTPSFRCLASASPKLRLKKRLRLFGADVVASCSYGE
eukprot:scaffold292178_cov27-Tisochrysis_lutea.AAC.5